jgi:hypothetical protein
MCFVGKINKKERNDKYRKRKISNLGPTVVMLGSQAVELNPDTAPFTLPSRDVPPSRVPGVHAPYMGL